MDPRSTASRAAILIQARRRAPLRPSSIRGLKASWYKICAHGHEQPNLTKVFSCGNEVSDTKEEMPKIKVRLFFDLIADSGESEMELEARDLHGLIEIMTRKMGAAFRGPLFDQQGRPRQYSQVYVNGTAYSLRDVANIGFKDGDVVLFVPVVGGG